MLRKFGGCRLELINCVFVNLLPTVSLFFKVPNEDFMHEKLSFILGLNVVIKGIISLVSLGRVVFSALSSNCGMDRAL